MPIEKAAMQIPCTLQEVNFITFYNYRNGIAEENQYSGPTRQHPSKSQVELVGLSCPILDIHLSTLNMFSKFNSH